MLQVKQTDITAALILTLTEKVTLADPYFLFVFRNGTTRGVIAFVKFSGDDESDYPDRYNQFTIDPSVLFAGAPVGEWHYNIYEQLSPSNLDPAAAGGLLEAGKLILLRDPAFAYKMYDSPTTYAAYNG